MIVGMWMTRNPVTTLADARLADAVRLMSKHSIRRLPVVENRGGMKMLVGILSNRDVFRAFPSGANPFAVIQKLDSTLLVKDGMSRGVDTTSPKAPIEEVARVLVRKKIGAMPVVRDEELVGIITESDIFRAFISILGIAEAGVRISFDVRQDEDAIGFANNLAHEHGLTIQSFLTAVEKGKPFHVVRVAGKETDAFIEAIWKSGHKVASVVRFERPES